MNVECLNKSTRAFSAYFSHLHTLRETSKNVSHFKGIPSQVRLTVESLCYIWATKKMMHFVSTNQFL